MAIAGSVVIAGLIGHLAPTPAGDQTRADQEHGMVQEHAEKLTTRTTWLHI